MSPPGGLEARRRRVLVASKSLAPGGAERLLVDLVRAGDRSRFEYEVAGVRADARHLEGELAEVGVPVHALGARGNVDASWLPAFRRLLVRGRFDVVHFHLPYTAALGRLVVASLPAPRPATVYTEHSIWSKTSPGVRALNRLTIGRDAAVVAVSDAAFDALPPVARRRGRVLEHGIDLTASRDLVARRRSIRADVRRELSVPPEQVLAVTVAGLRREKGHDVLLAAVDRVSRGDGAVRFVVAGDGALAAELETRRRQLGLEDSITYLGHREDARRLLGAADLMVLPSHHEGLPVTVMEAASLGIPVVATAVGGVPQAVSDGTTGLLVPPGDPEALAAAVARLAADPGLRRRLGDAALDQGARFDVHRAASVMESIYDKAGEGPVRG